MAVGATDNLVGERQRGRVLVLQESLVSALFSPITTDNLVGERQRGRVLVLQESLVSALFRPMAKAGETVGDQVLVNLQVEAQLSRPYHRTRLMKRLFT
jgi:hypothetical protein